MLNGKLPRFFPDIATHSTYKKNSFSKDPLSDIKGFKMSSFVQHPAPGGHTIHFRGDTITFTLENHSGKKGKAWLRSNIGHAPVRHREIINHTEQGLTPLARDWHDFPMEAASMSRSPR